MPVEINRSAIYTLGEIAELLKISERTLKRYILQGELRGRKVGRTWRTTGQQLLDFTVQPMKPIKRKRKGK